MKLILIPTPPFDSTAHTFSNGDEQIRKYENGRYWLALTILDCNDAFPTTVLMMGEFRAKI